MADDPALKDLADNLARVRRALDDMSKGAKDARDATGQMGAEAARASTATGTLARAVGGTLRGAFTELGGEIRHAAIDGLREFATTIPEAAARAEAHERALRQLGDAYGHVQHATNGAVSAEQAAAVQQRALQSGLRLSAQELAAVTSRAREFARSTGTDLGQALDQLTDQLVDPGEELRKFGVFLRTGMNAGDALRETLRQLGEQAGQTRTSQLSLTESMEAATRAQREASDALAGMIAQRLELADFFTQFASWATDAAGATSGWKTALDAVVGTMREAVGLRAEIGGAANQSASGAFTGQAGALAQQARARGLNLRGIQIGEFGVRASAAQRDGALALLRQAAAGGVTQEQLDAQLAELTGRANARELGRVGAERDRAEKAEYLRRQELRRRNQASQSASSPTEGPDLTGTYFSRPNQEAFAAWGQMFARERERALQERGGPIAQRLQGIELQRQSSEATAALDVAGQSTRGFMGGMFSRDAGQREVQQRQERIRILRDQREALAALLTESQREEDIARRMGRPIAEVNDLVRQRIGIQTALSQSTRDLVAAQEEQVNGFAVVGEKLIGVLEGVADGIAESVVAALEGSKSFGAAAEEMARASLRAVAKMAIVEVLKEGAMALAAAATYRYDAAVQHGLSAGMWGAVAVAAGAGVAAMGPSQKPAASSAGGSSGRSASTDRSARVDERSSGGPLNLTINVTGAAFTDAGVQQAVATGVRDAVGNGYLTRAHLQGVLHD